MVSRRWCWGLCVILCSVVVASLCQGQDLSCPTRACGLPSLGYCDPASGFLATLGVRKYINSFTSYQFPDPPGGEIGSNPLSRLEWPWDQLYGVARLGKNYQSFGVEIEYASTALLGSSLKAQDSDWTDPANPNQKTVFSDARAKPRGWTLDVCGTIPVPDISYVKGVLGFRAQQFNFTYTDLLQRELGLPPEFVPGEGIEFTEYYKHCYVGGLVSGLIPMGVLTERLASVALFVKAQLDWGYVTANNHDFHVLRGNRHTFENTRGSSWHANLTLGIFAGTRVKVDLEGDFIRIKTTGSHHLIDPPGDEGWDGAKVWSDQQFVTITGSYFF
jgi:hypothetical protein